MDPVLPQKASRVKDPAEAISILRRAIKQQKVNMKGAPSKEEQRSLLDTLVAALKEMTERD